MSNPSKEMRKLLSLGETEISTVQAAKHENPLAFIRYFSSHLQSEATILKP
jgi:hypothetical protein